LSLAQIGLHVEERRQRFSQPGANNGGTADDHGFQESHIEFSRQRGMSMRKEAVGHGAVQQGSDHPTMQIAGVALVQSLARKRGFHVAVGMRPEGKP